MIFEEEFFLRFILTTNQILLMRSGVLKSTLAFLISRFPIGQKSQDNI